MCKSLMTLHILEFFEVDADVIFSICKNDVPVLMSVITRMIEDLRL